MIPILGLIRKLSKRKAGKPGIRIIKRHKNNLRRRRVIKGILRRSRMIRVSFGRFGLIS